jgi:hypothetical protein
MNWAVILNLITQLASAVEHLAQTTPSGTPGASAIAASVKSQVDALHAQLAAAAENPVPVPEPIVEQPAA